MGMSGSVRSMPLWQIARKCTCMKKEEIVQDGMWCNYNQAWEES